MKPHHKEMFFHHHPYILKKMVNQFFLSIQETQPLHKLNIIFFLISGRIYLFINR